MNIGIDGTIWGGEETGVAASTRRLVLETARVATDQRFTVFLGEPARSGIEPIADLDHVQLVTRTDVKRGRRVLWQQLVLPRLAENHDVDVLYCPCYTVPQTGRVPRVVTVHDLIAWKRPDLCRRWNRLHMRALLPRSVRLSRGITVPTHTVKKDVRDLLGTPEEKIFVVPWGGNREIVPLDRSAAREEVSRTHGIRDPYVLFAGSREPKKNLGRVIEATRRIGALLVTVGPSGWGPSAGHENRGEDHVRHLGFVPDSQLGALYSAAEVFAFPSWIEGFGLPVLEAMACGAPVVASLDPALVEICGGAALHVPAGDASALGDALGRALRDPELRDRMIREGRVRATGYHWEESARAFLEALRYAVDAGVDSTRSVS